MIRKQLALDVAIDLSEELGVETSIFRLPNDNYAVAVFNPTQCELPMFVGRVSPDGCLHECCQPVEG